MLGGAPTLAWRTGRQEQLLDTSHMDPSRLIVEVPADDARQHLAQLGGAQAVFVEHPVRVRRLGCLRVSGLPNVWARMNRETPAIRNGGRSRRRPAPSLCGRAAQIAGYDLRKGVFGKCLAPDNQASAGADGGDPPNAAQAVRAWPGRVGPKSGLRVDDAERLVKELETDLGLAGGGQLGRGRARPPRRGRLKGGQGPGAGGLTRQSRRFAKSQAKHSRAGAAPAA